MAFDITRLAIFEEIERSKRGDHSLLVDMLRSQQHLPQPVREYIAAELERPPKQRFARRIRRSLDVVQKDRDVLRLMAAAKIHIAFEQIYLAEADAMEPQHPPLENIEWRHVANNLALDRLAEEGFEIDEDELNNALGRLKAREPKEFQRLTQRPLLTF